MSGGPEIVVVGAGGMGALFGAILQDGGLRVTLVDTDTAHVEAITPTVCTSPGSAGTVR